jgi:hypothetical protein
MSRPPGGGMILAPPSYLNWQPRGICWSDPGIDARPGIFRHDGQKYQACAAHLLAATRTAVVVGADAFSAAQRNAILSTSMCWSEAG